MQLSGFKATNKKLIAKLCFYWLYPVSGPTESVIHDIVNKETPQSADKSNDSDDWYVALERQSRHCLFIESDWNIAIYREPYNRMIVFQHKNIPWIW